MRSELKTVKELTHCFSASDFGHNEGSNGIKNEKQLLSNDIRYELYPSATGEYVRNIFKKEGKKIVRNLQSEDSIYPKILNKFPEEMKGEIAKDLWNNTKFRYGAEYGMMAILMHFLNIEKEDLNGK